MNYLEARVRFVSEEDAYVLEVKHIGELGEVQWDIEKQYPLLDGWYVNEGILIDIAVFLQGGYEVSILGRPAKYIGRG